VKKQNAMLDCASNRRSDDLLLTIFTIVSDTVRDTLDKHEAIELSQKVVDEICHHFSGESIYIGKNRTANSIIKSNQIWDDFTGDNHLALSKKYDCTIQWIYSVVRTMYKIKQSDMQGDLFGEVESNVN